MARKQNFSYQKFQRENAKAMKREAKKEQRARSTDPELDAAADADRPQDADPGLPVTAATEDQE